MFSVNHRGRCWFKHFEPGIFVGRGGEAEGALLESCVDNDVAAAIPAEQFDTIAAMVSEEESGEGIGAEIFADELSETVETFAHIDRLGANVDASEFGKH
jgi:hypothetical protein